MTWKANLSNGEALVEGKVLSGERTPWQKLLNHCKVNDLKLTGLQLEVGDIVVTAMPHKMCDGYFHAYEALRIMFRDQVIHRQGVGSIIGDKVYITWIDLNMSPDGKYNIHHDIRPLSEVKIHTTVY